MIIFNYRLKMKPKDKNILFVQLILENKEMLFGKHSNKITQDGKNQIWDSIRLQMVNAGVVEGFAGKSPKELSAKFSDLKSRTQDKKDGKQTTGTGKIIYTEVDERILDIIGRDSTVMNGLPVADSGEEPTAFETDEGAAPNKKIKLQDKPSRSALFSDSEDNEGSIDVGSPTNLQHTSSTSQLQPRKSSNFFEKNFGTSPNMQQSNSDSQLHFQNQFDEILDIKGFKPAGSAMQPHGTPKVNQQPQSQNRRQLKREHGKVHPEVREIDVQLKNALAEQQRSESELKSELLRWQIEEQQLKVQLLQAQAKAQIENADGLGSNVIVR